MAGFKIQQMQGDKPVAGISTGISAALVHTDRGIPNKPFFSTGFGQWVEEFGYYISDSSANYQVRAAYNNGARTIAGIRLVGPDAKCAKGADDYKLDQSKAQLTHGAAAAALHLLANTRGVNGALDNITITNAPTDDITTVSVANDYDISLVLAKTSAWKKSAKVCSTVINGQSHLIIGTNADDSICFYANTPGTGGNSYAVRIIDSGGGGPATYSFSADGYTLTIDLAGVAVTAATAVTDINLLAGGIRCYLTGTGAGNIGVSPLASLAGGQALSGALVTATYGSTGLSAVTTLARTFLSGQGAVTVGGHTFADANTLDPITLVTSKVIPGDTLVIYNGANAGAYEITEVNSQTGLTIDATWTASQTNIIYAIYGTDGEYGHANIETLSPGSRGNYMYMTVTKENDGVTLKAVLKVLDGDGITRTLETFRNLNPAKDDADFFDTRIAAESRWVRTTMAPEKVLISAADGASSIGVNILTSAGSTFVDDEVEVGDIVVITSSTTASDIKVVEVTEVTDNTHIKVSENFNGTAVNIAFKVLGADHDGSALLALVGTSGLTLTMAGGISDAPTKDEYLGVEASKTGVYAIDDMPVTSRPNKFWCPDSPIAVDDSGVDSTLTIDTAMIAYAEARLATAKQLVYLFSAEYGLIPTTLLTAIASDGIDSTRAAEYWPWVRLSDPVSGSYKWVPVTGHMIGVYDSMDAGPEGMHAAPANVVLRDVACPPNSSCIEYECSDAEYELLVEANINPIMRISGYRPYGARARTTDVDWQHIHKTLVSDRTVRSIVNNLKTWLPFRVQSRTTWGKVRKSIDGYMMKYDRRKKPNGAFEHYLDANAQPWYVTCDETNNSMSDPKIVIQMGYCVVNTIEEIEFRFGLWDGGVEVEAV